MSDRNELNVEFLQIGMVDAWIAAKLPMFGVLKVE
jgi:hypothetical protein